MVIKSTNAFILHRGEKKPNYQNPSTLPLYEGIALNRKFKTQTHKVITQ